ncbi:MAG: flagellin [Gemmatimonadota bacterium]|nr:flagellin [Gemmatimonadota bacterium]
MGLVLNTNIPSVNARRNLLINNRRLGKSLEKLSSGMRINRAADDAAGLSIAENLRAQVKGLGRAVANSQDAISLIQTAEGGLNETHNVLQRIRFLAVQSANGTYTSRDRSAIQDEVAQLIDEVDRISATTSFNSISLLNGNVGALVSTNDPVNSIQGLVVDDVGVGGTFCVEVSAYSVGKLQVQNTDIFVTIKENGDPLDAVAATQLQSISRFTEFGVFTGGIDSVTLTLSQDGDNKVTDIQVFATDTLGQLAQKISLGINDPNSVRDLGMAATISDGATLLSIGSIGPCGGATATSMVLTTPEPGRKLVFGGDESLLSALSWNEIQTAVAPVFSIVVTDIGEGTIPTRTSKVYGDRASGMIQGVDLKFRTTLDISISATEKDVLKAFQISKVMTNAQAGADGFVVHVAPRPLSFQIGPNHGNYLNTQIGDMSATSLGIKGLNLSDQFLAQESIRSLDQAISQVSAQRAALGAVQNRLESTIANLNVARENLSASESQIRDLDYSEEVINYTSSMVLTNAANSFLAQSNSMNNNILQLLQ